MALTKGVKPDAIMLKTLLSTVVQHGDESSAHRFYGNAKRRAEIFGSGSLAPIAIAAAKKGKLDFARSIVEDGHQQMGIEFGISFLGCE